MAYNETPTKGHAMFLKNREFRIKVVKNPRNDELISDEMEESLHTDPETITKIAKEIVKISAIAVISVLVVDKVLTTASEIAVKKTKSADNQ
jgi:hypothetical protein